MTALLSSRQDLAAHIVANEATAEPGIRLDNSDSVVIGWLALDFDPNDPGATPPADCCLDCVRVQFYDDDILDFEIDHPPYADGVTCDFALQ